MSGINQLTEQVTVNGSDQIPLYSTTNGQPRKASMNAVLNYVVDNMDTVLQPLALKSYLLSELPPAASHPFSLVYCLNGNAGEKCLAVSDGTAWKVVAMGATVS